MRLHLLGAMLLTMGCSSPNQNHAVSTDPERSGSDFVPYSSKYNDSRPSLSADGTKVVFISGRDSTDQAGTQKAYKADWAAGAAPGPLTRVTASELGVESLAQLSPDGNWIALVVTTAGKTDLYLQDYAGTQAALKVTTDGLAKDFVSFSADSKMLAWTARDPAALTAIGMVVPVGDGSATALAAANQVAVPGVTGTAYVGQLFWLPSSGGNYILGEALGGHQGATLFSYYQVAFATAPAAATATPTLWVDKVPADLNVMPAASGDKAILPWQHLPNDTGATLKIGDGVDPNAAPQLDIMSVYSEPIFLGLAAGAVPSRYPAPVVPSAIGVPGYDLLAAGLAADGSTAFLLERAWYNCTNEPDSFGTNLVVAPADVNNSNITHLWPRLVANNNSWDTVSGATVGQPGAPCDRRADGSRSHLDDRWTGLVVAANATATTFRIAYVTRFTTHFDASCALKSGDPEVMLLDGSAAAKTFYPLSANQAPIGDDDRGGQAACVF